MEDILIRMQDKDGRITLTIAWIIVFCKKPLCFKGSASAGACFCLISFENFSKNVEHLPSPLRKFAPIWSNQHVAIESTKIMHTAHAIMRIDFWFSWELLGQNNKSTFGCIGSTFAKLRFSMRILRRPAAKESLALVSLQCGSLWTLLMSRNFCSGAVGFQSLKFNSPAHFGRHLNKDATWFSNRTLFGPLAYM